MDELRKVLYTAQATIEGGRNGHGRTSDGRLDVDLDVPSEMEGPGGPGTNPEQLFAVGFAACLHSAVMGVARGRDLDVSQSRMTSEVSIGPVIDGGFGLAVKLEFDAPGIDPEDAVSLLARAHERCPYSKATRGNIHVTSIANGRAV
jgi:lipoyl-dependent peroxiredoxin